MIYPCDKCDLPDPQKDHCTAFKSCPAWTTWFRKSWKQFNEIAKKYGIKPTTKESL